MARCAALKGSNRSTLPAVRPHIPFLTVLSALSCCMLPETAHAQPAEAQYLSQVMAGTSKKQAAYYRVAEDAEGGSFVGRTYTMAGKLKVEGRYADPELSIEHGPFVFYHANGEVESRGEYVMGNKSGVWERFDQYGRPLAEKIYDPEPLANIVYTRAQTMPRYNGGDERALVRYIKSQVEAPTGRKVRGEVMTSFIVEKSGVITNIKVMDGDDPVIDEQVVQAIKATSPWQPGAEKGQAVRVQVRVPVQF